MDKFNDELLKLENGEEVDEEFLNIYKNIVKNQESDQGIPNPLADLSKSVAPTPGCCVKTKNTQTGEKIFINICTSSDIPAPPEISEEELQELISKIDDEESIIDYRIPMGIGEPHAEIENKGKGCTAYDIMISPNFLHKINNSKIFLGFFMSVVFEGILNKYSITMDRNWSILKKRKFFGSILEQNIRQKKLIEEVNNKPTATSTKGEKPDFVIMREPVDGHPEYLIAEIKLPKVARSNAITVDIGEDCIVVSARPHLYYLNVYLPFKLKQEESGSQYNTGSKILTITMPVQPM